MSLSGKTALVTGGSSPIGRAIVLELAARGADVAVHCFRNRQKADDVASQAEALGVRSIVVKAHFGKPEEIARVFAEVDEAFGGLDILVNNAASAVFRPVLELDEQAWDWTIGVMAQAALRCAQQAAPRLESRGGGRIVNVSSLGSQRTLPGYAMAGMAKSALESLTRYLAAELAPRKILVNAVAPGAVVDSSGASPWDRHPEGNRLLAEIASRTPLGRLTTPHDVARLVGFLGDDAPESIIGQTLILDGGCSLLA